ncbi:MAG: RNA polymerase subunit sigma [Sphingomonadales bacterium]|nr:MAG: RNA polymerase subunit sigma [Sphingomonadales bacterium]
MQSNDTDQATPDRETLRRLEDAMLALPRLTRNIFMAHRLDDMDYIRIAERTGLTIRDVERHLAKALVEIDRQLSGKERSRWWRWWRRIRNWFE